MDENCIGPCLINVAFACIIIIIISIGWEIYANPLAYDFRGVYQVDPEFAEAAGLNKAILYIGEKKTTANRGRQYEGYLYMTTNTNSVIEDQAVKINVHRSFPWDPVYNLNIIGGNTWDDTDIIAVHADKKYHTLHIFNKEDRSYLKLMKDFKQTKFCDEGDSKCVSNVMSKN